jgi:RNA-binding protein
MLTSRQRSYLRGLANTLPPIFQVGKGGVNDNMIKQFADALEARELVKASVLNNSSIDAREICREISTATQAQVVQVIGSKFVLYKESKNNKVIDLT